ncbi:hypothetical protein ACA491_06050 [Staphylococcus aureus]
MKQKSFWVAIFVSYLFICSKQSQKLLGMISKFIQSN